MAGLTMSFHISYTNQFELSINICIGCVINNRVYIWCKNGPIGMEFINFWWKSTYTIAMAGCINVTEIYWLNIFIFFIFFSRLFVFALFINWFTLKVVLMQQPTTIAIPSPQHRWKIYGGKRIPLMKVERRNENGK